MKICFFLTATITPKDTPLLKHKNPRERENEYLISLKNLIKYKLPIIFCENSNTKSEKIIHLLNESKIEFEYLCFESEKSNLGKGNGEAEIFLYALNNSNILKNNDFFVKITGRYIIKNLSKQLKSLEKNTIYFNISQNLKWTDSRFFIFNYHFYTNYFVKNFNELDEKKGIYMEHILNNAILKYIADNNKWNFLNNFPIYEGIYGTDKIKYKNNFLKNKIKEILYKLKKQMFSQNI